MNTNKANAIGIAVITSAAAAWLIVSIQQFISHARHPSGGMASESGVLILAVAAFYFVIAALLLVKQRLLKLVVIVANVPPILISLYLLFVAMADPVAIVFFAMISVPSITAIYVSAVPGIDR